MSLTEVYQNYLKSVELFLNIDLSKYKEFSEEQQLNNLYKFYNCLEDSELFLLFSSCKIKVFSSKNDNTRELSESLFDSELLLKNLFNNQKDDVKLRMWYATLNLYLHLEKNKENREGRVELLEEKLSTITVNEKKNIKTSLLKSDVNETTNNMLDDIVGSFQDIVSDNKNPFENIMGITQKISQKYFKDIENGNIEIDKLLGDITGQLGNKEEMGQVTKMMEQLNGGEGSLPNLTGMLETISSGGLGQMMGNLTGNTKKEPVAPTIIDETFSTANVEQGEEKEEKRGPNIANMAKGLGNMGDMMKGLGGMGDMMKNLTGMMSGDDEQSEMDLGKLQESMSSMMGGLTSMMGNSNPELKETMDKMMSGLSDPENMDISNLQNMMSNMGLDMSQLTKSMEDMVNGQNDDLNVHTNDDVHTNDEPSNE